MKSRLCSILLCLGFLSACAGPAQAPTPTRQPTATMPPPLATATPLPSPTQSRAPTLDQATVEVVPTDILAPQATETPLAPATPTATPPYDPESWQEQPVIPVISSKMREVYQRGLELGNNPHSFSKIGDCETQTEYFLIEFDLGTRGYNLGPYPELKDVIDQFSGSFKRPSLAAKRGFTAASALAVFESDPQKCQGNETPLACEYRLGKPSFALIMMGTNDAINRRKSFESYMRQIIEFSLQQGVIPILATKADNIEGDNSINKTIAWLAHEYEVPLWNFWLAVQPLPNHGLMQDGVHLTFEKNHFDDPADMQNAWPIRNLTALQVLGAAWRSVSGQ